MLIDPFERHVTYLRVSVTDRCDFRCVYCMSEHMSFLPKAELLTLEELDRLCSAFVGLGVRKLRITGGEPLVRKGVIELFESLSRHLRSGALDELTLTTNGSQLPRHAERLYAAGVRRVNISLDTRDPEKFVKITRWGRLDQVMAGIDAARAAGLKIKINTVALRGVNENEIEDLVAWCGAEGHDLTFIETMPLGEIDGDRTEQYLPLSHGPCQAPQALDPGRERPSHGRAGALRHGAGDRPAFGFHHAAHPQFLRILQPGAAHLHRHALHVPRPGGRGPTCARRSAAARATRLWWRRSTRRSGASPRAMTSSSTAATRGLRSAVT